MFKNLVSSSLVIPFFLLNPIISFSQELNKDENTSIKSLLSKQIINFEDIPMIIEENNLELKSLKELISALSYNLSSKIAKRYPSLDLTANGLPQYLYSENFNNSSIDTKTSQFKFNPSLNIKWDLIDPQRSLEIKSARNNFEVAKNNFEIKKNDLIQEAKARYHKFHKASEDKKNAQIAVDLSLTSLKDAKAKLDAGIGTKFDVLEANAQLARDEQFLREKTISKEISLISLKEIFNVNFEDEIFIKEKQELIGFWNFPLKMNISSGLKNSYSLRNLNLESLIKQNQADSFRKANSPKVYITNNLSSSLSKGSALSSTIDPEVSSSTYSNKISLNFTWLISNGGQNKNSYLSKTAEVEAEKFSYLNLQNIIKTNISEAYLNLIKNEEKLISTNKEIDSTKESLRLARLRYEVGISTLKDVLIRQKELTSAKSKNIDAIYNYNLNLDKLERLTFLSKSKDCDKDNKSKGKQIYSICDY